MPKKPGILCLEGDWSRRRDDRQTVRPQLQMLQDGGVTGFVIHHRVATREEFEHRAHAAMRGRVGDPGVVYLASHGSEGAIHLGAQDLSLDEVAEVFGGRLRGRVAYFGSCSVLAAPAADLRRFCRTTGARAVVGYTGYVEWFESAAFDFLLLPELLEPRFSKLAYDRLVKEHKAFAERLGLRFANARFATPDAPARRAAAANR